MFVRTLSSCCQQLHPDSRQEPATPTAPASASSVKAQETFLRVFHNHAHSRGSVCSRLSYLLPKLENSVMTPKAWQWRQHPESPEKCRRWPRGSSLQGGTALLPIRRKLRVLLSKGIHSWKHESWKMCMDLENSYTTPFPTNFGNILCIFL